MCSRRNFMCIIIIQFFFIFYFILQLISTNKEHATYKEEEEPIDVVYTWVNGSEERFLQQLYDNFGVDNDLKDDINGEARYAANQELIYSLRSIEKYMPWIRHVYVVTNGQTPNWLNLQNGHATVIPHEMIFPNRSHLPTFSSPAIESNLHRIPGLSERFLYFNDDCFLGAPVEYSTFFTRTDGQLFYGEFKVPSCAHMCPWSKVANGRCDHACYVPECQLDGGDCHNHNPPDLLAYGVRLFLRKLPTHAYGLSIQNTQRLLNKQFGFKDRYVMPHIPALLDVNILREAWKDFPVELSNTSSHKFRDATDIQFQFFYASYAQEKQTILSLKEALQTQDVNQDGVLNNDEVDFMINKHYKHKIKPDEDDINKFKTALNKCFINYEVTESKDCLSLAEFVKTTLRAKRKFKSLAMTGVPNVFYKFGSLNSNLNHVDKILNDLRNNPRKFICFNDDLTHKPKWNETNRLIYKKLALFYQSMFPKMSKYELPKGSVNPTGKYIHELYLDVKTNRNRKTRKTFNNYYYFGWMQCVIVIVIVILWFMLCIVRLHHSIIPF